MIPRPGRAVKLGCFTKELRRVHSSVVRTTGRGEDGKPRKVLVGVRWTAEAEGVVGRDGRGRRV